MFRQRALVAVLGIVSTCCISAPARATLVVSVYEHSPAVSAIAADSSLAGFLVDDVLVTQAGGDHFASADLRCVFSQAGSGSFYVPSFDPDTSQKPLWTLLPWLEDDTFVTTPDYFGTSNLSDLSHISIFGGAAYPIPDHSADPAIMPKVTNDRGTVDISFGDPAAASSTLGDGTYLIARLTRTRSFINIWGRVSGTQNPGSFVPFSYTDGPEPSQCAVLGLATVFLHRAGRRARADSGLQPRSLHSS